MWSKASREVLGVILLLLLVAGCTRGSTSSRSPIHLNPNMDRQPKYMAQAESAFFYNGATMRPPVEGTVARGELWENYAVYSGRDDAGVFVATNPMPVTDEVLRRGEERYGIFCLPCHGERGNGRGMLFERSGVESADLLQERIVAMPAGEMFDVITNGLGLMQGYRYPIPPDDRWAIIAHVRQIQQGAVP